MIKKTARMLWKGIQHPEYIFPYLCRELPDPPAWAVHSYTWQGGWKRYLGKYGICSEPYKIALRGQSQPYFMRWKDKEVLEEFYNYDGYTDLTLSDYTTVIDIGAHIGLFTIKAVKSGSTVYAFEPSPHSYECLLRNLELHEVSDNVVPQNTAISSETGCTEITISDEESLFDSTEVQVSGMNRIVASTTLAEISKNHDFRGNTLLKMDCEGAEFEIISSSTEADLEDIDTIFLEYHKKRGDPKDIERKLTIMGYSVSTRPDPRPFVSDDLGFILAEK